MKSYLSTLLNGPKIKVVLKNLYTTLTINVLCEFSKTQFLAQKSGCFLPSAQNLCKKLASRAKKQGCCKKLAQRVKY